MLGRNIGLQWSATTSLSSSVSDSSVRLGVNHEAPNIPSNDVGSLIISRKSRVPYARDPYFNKLIAK
jgi:hypothetical protein